MRLPLLLLALPACDALFLPNRTPPAADAPPPDARTLYAAAVLDDAPLAYWRLAATASPTIPDETGHGNVGLRAGDVQVGAFAGALVDDSNGATRFDGDDDAITAGDRFEFADRAAFSLEAWVRPSVHANYLGVLSKSDEANGGTNVTGYHIYDQFSHFGCERGDGLAKEAADTPAIAVDAWVHVVCTYDGTTLRLYLDGTEQASTPSSLGIPATTKPFAIGARNGGSWLFFDGAIDEVAVYDTVLSPARIEAHRRIGLGL